MNLGVNKLWETVIYYKKFDDCDFRNCLTEDIMNNLDLYCKNSFEVQDGSIFNLDRPVIQKFKEELVLPTAYEYLNIIDVDIRPYKLTTKAWLTGQGVNYNLNYHNHKGASISAVFYPFIGEKNNSSGGQIVFHDPRSNANRGYLNNFSKLFEPKTFLPETGDIIVFPSFLYHHVNTYFSKLRIGIAVDYFTDGDNNVK